MTSSKMGSFGTGSPFRGVEKDRRLSEGPKTVKNKGDLVVYQICLAENLRHPSPYPLLQGARVSRGFPLSLDGRGRGEGENGLVHSN